MLDNKFGDLITCEVVVILCQYKSFAFETGGHTYGECLLTLFRRDDQGIVLNGIPMTTYNGISGKHMTMHLNFFKRFNRILLFDLVCLSFAFRFGGGHGTTYVQVAFLTVYMAAWREKKESKSLNYKKNKNIPVRQIFVKQVIQMI